MVEAMSWFVMAGSPLSNRMTTERLAIVNVRKRYCQAIPELRGRNLTFTRSVKWKVGLRRTFSASSSTTMRASSSKPRRRRPKRDRQVRWLVRPSLADGGRGTVEIQVNRKPDTYAIRRLAVDFGVAGFELVKLGTNIVYQVLLDGRHSLCDCIGHARHGHCKHVEALQALFAAPDSDMPVCFP
jgi:hypothetical protein